jgi:molybdate transport system substrate-binding protein
MLAKILLLISLLSGLVLPSAQADEITIAVASNFTSTLEKIRQEFETQSEHKVTIVSGSSGRLYAQIANGAPFDLFLSADSDKPQALETAGIIEVGSRRIYALGRLVLWSRLAEIDASSADILRTDTITRLAIANPRVAPYGVAAISVLQALGLESRYRDRLVQGENIAQAYQFVDSGNATAGFVALSQVLGRPNVGTYWEVPTVMHSPLAQELAVIKEGVGVQAFVDFLQHDSIRALILESGYELPPVY